MIAEEPDALPEGAVCERLRSALAERDWIETLAGTPQRVARLAFVDYPRPAVIYGRRGGDEVARIARGAQLGADVLQRRTGGGAVYAGPWMLGVNVALSPGDPVASMGVIASLRWFGGALLEALAQVGIEARVADADRIAASAAKVREAGLDWACFAGVSHGELLDGQGRKLLGTCQWRGRWGVLLSGGLLLAATPLEEFEFIHHGVRPPRSRLRDFVSDGEQPAAGLEELRNALARRLLRGFA